MAKKSFTLRNSPGAFSQYSQCMTLIAEQIDHWFKHFMENPISPPFLIGDFVALRVLMEGQHEHFWPHTLPAKLRDWKEKFYAWIAKSKATPLDVEKPFKREDVLKLADRELGIMQRMIAKSQLRGH